MTTKLNIARNTAEVKRQLARSGEPVTFVACTRCTLHDPTLVELYVLQVDSRLGTYRGLGSTCVQRFELIAENLNPLLCGDAYPRAVAAAEARIGALASAQRRAVA